MPNENKLSSVHSVDTQEIFITIIELINDE